MNPQLRHSPLEAPPGHLSEEVVNGLLIGGGAPEAEAHLAACAFCQSRVASFRSDLALFNQTTLAWTAARIEAKSESAAESLSEAMASALRTTPQPRPAGIRTLTWKPLTALTAAVLIALAGWNYRHAKSIPVKITTMHAAGEFIDSPDQVAEDNQLLSNVYDALDEEPSTAVIDLSPIRGRAASDTLTKARTQ